MIAKGGIRRKLASYVRSTVNRFRVLSRTEILFPLCAGIEIDFRSCVLGLMRAESTTERQLEYVS